VLNILYLHTAKPYIDDLLDYWMSGECIVLLLCHETENPIEKWKKMIGVMDPVEAKVRSLNKHQKADPTSLRAQFGSSVIRNEFHGSDHPTGTNKERDIFKFPIP
jgi:nucleoside diphosphate kinase